MTQLLGPNGRPISTEILNKKEAPPPTGAAFGAWAGRDITFKDLPGGGIVQFNLNALTTTDFRNMRDHYQVNASLAVLTFMQHQSDWHIESKNPKVAAFCEEALRNIWTGLNRALGTANWAGYSPSALEWENDPQVKGMVPTKVKDLIPEECEVSWKEVKGWAPTGRTPPIFYEYDGIKQFGQPWPIPVDNSFWYPMLMENGDYRGRKLLRPAFQSWYFSILVHLFANRYYERFGEPTPVGRAPFDSEIRVGDKETLTSQEYMLRMLAQLRSRGVIVLPSDRDAGHTGAGTAPYEYELEYLESQMRGADFERYLTRLDEEISIGLFTPILLLRTADVGSYNLGVGHMQMYLWMLNAMNDDRKQYIDKYLLRRIVNYNFGKNAPDAKIVFRKLGNANAELVQALLTALIQNGKAVPDLQQLGQIAGLTINEIKETTEPDPAPEPDDDPAPDPAPEPDGPPPADRSARPAHGVVREVVNRVRPQVEAAYKTSNFGQINMGFRNRMQRSLAEEGIKNAAPKTDEIYRRMDNLLNYWRDSAGTDFADADDFVAFFEYQMNSELGLISA